MAVWINTSLASRDSVRVCFSDARCQVIHVTCANLKADIFNCYAPHSGREVIERASWWASLSKLFGKYHRPSAMAIVADDSNARIGSHVSDAVGPTGAEHETQNGAELHALLVQSGL